MSTPIIVRIRRETDEHAAQSPGQARRRVSTPHAVRQRQEAGEHAAFDPAAARFFRNAACMSRNGIRDHRKERND